MLWSKKLTMGVSSWVVSLNIEIKEDKQKIFRQILSWLNGRFHRPQQTATNLPSCKFSFCTDNEKSTLINLRVRANNLRRRKWTLLWKLTGRSAMTQRSWKEVAKVRATVWRIRSLATHSILLATKWSLGGYEPSRQQKIPESLFIFCVITFSPNCDFSE